MTGLGPNKRKSMMVHESIGMPIHHRDASNTPAYPWKKNPTPISVPATNDRPRSHSSSYMRVTSYPTSRQSVDDRPSFRSHDNPYVLTKNTLNSRNRHPGNPNVRQTVLGVPRSPHNSSADSHARKRPRLDTTVSSTMPSNGASSSYARGPAPCSSVSEPDIQVIEPPRAIIGRSNPVPNDAEIIELGASSDDLGERVPRGHISSSPDPILLAPGEPHPFETRPTQYSSSNKGKSRAKQPPELVEGSEEDDNIEEFTPPPIGRSSNAMNSHEIPVNIVHERKKFFEGGPVSAPAAVRYSIEKGVNPVDLTTRMVISKMKKKNEGALGHQRGTLAPDHIGTSSSNFRNSAREKEKTLTLPLDAWCLGQHFFKHSESAPLKLAYKVALQRIQVAWGPSSLEKIEFRLNSDVCSVMVVNDSEEPLKKDIVVQFTVKPGSTWEEAERIYKGFKAGAGRGRGVLTFHISIAKDRGSSVTDYQRFVTVIRKALQASVVEVIKPSKGAVIWDYAVQSAAMLQQGESRNRNNSDQSEGILDEPSAVARSATSCSSTSVKIGPELLPNEDSGPSTSYRRSARQSAVRTLRASPPPPPPAQLEPDEVVLIYPPSGTGALSVMHSDLRRLQPEEYLNDTLIEFGLKLWLNDLRAKNPTLADQIHVFSSFFYKKLNNRKNPEDGYKSVRKWTSKVPLFAKKYIIVPINENVHWYLAVIYEPGHTLEPPLLLSQSQPSNPRMTRKRKQQQERAKAHSETLTEASLERLSPGAHVTEGEPGADTSSVDATRVSTPNMTENEEMDDTAITVFHKSCSITVSDPTFSEIQIRDSSPNLVHPPSDSMDVDADTSAAEVLEPSASKSKSGVPVSQFYGSVHEPEDVKPVVIEDEDSGEDQRQEAEVDDMLAVMQSSTIDSPPQTYIFTLDSLGARHPQAIKVLKYYLKSEAKDKHNFDEVRDAVGKQVQVPVQPNTWDCGIYLLHFMKVLMSSPSEFVEKILSTRGTMPSPERKKMWRDHEVPQFRDYLQCRITRLSEEWMAQKSVREEGANKRRSGDALEAEALSSEGEVDIVEDIPSVKATLRPKQKQLAARLRG